MTFIELPFDIRQENHDGKVFPQVASSELQGLTHEGWSSDLSTGCFSSFDTEDALALEAVEVLGEAAAIGEKVMPLNGQREKRIELIERV